MKKIFTSLLMVCATCGVMAQSVTSYYMPDAIERTNLNVALAPERGYFAIPLVGSMSLNVNGNLSVSSVIYQQSNEIVTLLDSSISSSEALGNLDSGINFMGISNRVDVLSFGGYAKNHRNFWSFNVSLRTNANYSLPYEFFEFVKLGTENNIKGINFYAESFVDVGFGYSKMVNEKLTIGARLKVLVGLASASLNVSNFDVKMNSEIWSVDMAGALDVYGPGFTNEGAAGTEFDVDDISMSGISPAGLGVAIDLGAEYAINRRLHFTFAANDLGFIRWNQKSGVSASMAATQSFAGIEIDGSGGVKTPDFSFDDVTLNNAESSSTTRFMQANLNVGAEYRIFKELISVGTLYTAQFWNSKTMHNFTTALTLRPLSWVTLATSYSFANNKGNSLGLAANFSPTWINIYVATDILLTEMSTQYVPINQSNMSVSLGLAIPLGKRSLRSKYTKWTIEE